MQLVIASVLPLHVGLWESPRKSSRILIPFSFFTYYGSLWDGVPAMRLIANCAVNAVPTLLFLVVGYLFAKFGRVPLPLLRFELLLNDIVVPVTSTWTFASIGDCIGRTVTSGFSGTLLVLALIASVLICVLYNILYFCYFLAIAYHPAGAIFWFSSGHVESLVGIGIVVLLSRACCATEGAASVVILTLLMVWLAALYVWEVRMMPYISQSMSIAFETFCCSSFAVAFFQFIRLLGAVVDQDFVIFVVPATSVFFFFLARLRYARTAITFLTAIEDLQEHPETTVDAPYTMVKLYRFGFPLGHPYLLNWAPFVAAVQHWPNSIELWQQFMRFVAIYPEHTVRFLGIVTETKLLSRSDRYLLGLRKVA
jgi:hypothetical protein